MIRAFLKKVTKLTSSSKRASSLTAGKVRIIPRKEHRISRLDISENALKVLNRLHKKGYSAYLVGGSVRDLLLGLHPKDFDVVTDAKPEEIKAVFRNCRLIGRRFRLAHVYFGSDIIEVATFRRQATQGEQHTQSEQGMILRDNEYGTLDEDVWRRDFTLNALYYNIADFSLVDYCNGFEDIKAKRLIMIGDEASRFREDPVRMLRAVRFACKVGFKIPSSMTRTMQSVKHLVSHVSSARLFEEVLKMFHSGKALAIYQKLVEQDLFGELFPETSKCLTDSNLPHQLLCAVFESTDKRIQASKTVTPAFIVAGLLWEPICQDAKRSREKGVPPHPAMLKAISQQLNLQIKRLSIPRRIVQGAREIWLLQSRLTRRHPKHLFSILEEPRFRAAFDFLELRAKAGDDVEDVVNWWRAFMVGDEAERQELIKQLGNKPRRRKRRSKKSSQQAGQKI